MNAIALGPLVLAADPFAALLAIAVFLVTSAILARRVDRRLDNWATIAVLTGIIAARAGHVLKHWDSFSEEPGRILALWQGGFDVPSGLLVSLWSRPGSRARCALCRRRPWRSGSPAS